MMLKRLLCSLYALVCLGAFVECAAQDWNQWRGPNRDGLVARVPMPKVWPEKLKPIWKLEVGIGHSSPIVVGRRIYVLTRRNETEGATCIDFETGKQLWSDTYQAPYTMNPAAVQHGKGPKSTPIVYDNKLYTLGISGVLSCYDASDGKVKWRKEFAKQFKTTSPLYGSAASPLVYKGMVIIHVGGHDSGALTAFDCETGEVKWSWNGDGPGYASPIVFESGGVAQIVTQTQRSIAGFSAATGELLWQIPFKTEFDQNIVTPVAYKDILIFSGIDKGTAAFRLANRSGKWTPEEVWRNTEVSMYMNSPVVVGDFIYGLSHKKKGQLFCVDARTGKTMWTSTGRDGDNAAIVSGGGLLFVLNEAGELTIAKADPSSLEVVKKYSAADSATWAHPVIIGNRILVKDVASLSLLGFE